MTGICPHCGSHFNLNRKDKIYCSRKCKQKACFKRDWSHYLCRNRIYRNKRGRHKYSKEIKKIKCESCGFVPVNKCQLDIDHRDGDHKNNELSNLQVLCANCHRLKTFLNNENCNKNILDL
jgi:hypothetical protein